MTIAWILAAVLLAPGSADAAEPEDDLAELTRLERVWNEAHLEGDAEALDRLWAEDLAVTVPRMRRLSRADALAMARSGRIRFERYETADLLIRVFGDSAVVTGRLLRTRRVEGESFDDDWQFTKVYLRQEGRWRVVSFHASEAPL